MSEIEKSQNRTPLTVNGMVDMAYGTAKAAGWHDKDHIPLTPQDPHSHIAAMMMILLPWAGAVEAIRKNKPVELGRELRFLAELSEETAANGTEHRANLLMNIDRLEPWQMRLLGWLGLKVTELVEAAEAVINRDKTNFAEELGDEKIRIGDTVGAINDDPDHPFNGIDLEATILAKNERNLARGYRHQNDTGTPKLA